MIDEAVIDRTRMQLADAAATLTDYLDGDAKRTSDLFMGCAIGVLVATQGPKAASDHLLRLAAALEEMSRKQDGASAQC